MPAPSRSWVFTAFNLALLPLLQASVPNGVRYLVMQEEVCPETGRQHYQGYVEFNSPVRMRKVKELLQDEAMHLEVRKGSRDEAREYAMKEETRVNGPYEFGTWIQGQGTRSDLASVKAAIDAGCSAMELCDADFTAWCKYRSSLDAYHSMRYMQGATFRVVSVHVRWGASGVGKSRWAADSYPGAYWVAPPRARSDGIWFDGYTDHTTIVLDDFDGWLPYRLFLRYTDGYPLLLPVKGSHVPARYDTVVITSNKHPRAWYDGCDWAPVERRLQSVVHEGCDYQAAGVRATCPGLH